MKTILALVMSSILLVGCGNYKTKTNDIKIDVSAEGPFSAGSNSLIGELQFDGKDFLEDADFNEIANVRINGISVEMQEGQEMSLDQFTSASIQLVSNNNPMTSVGIMNPIEVVDDELSMTISDEADVTSFFQDGKFSILLDLDFMEDSYIEQLEAELELSLTIEYK